MLEPLVIDEIGVAIRSASASTEAKFVKIGQRLESSVEILGKVAATFENLSGELKSENLQRATDDLSRAASQVVAIGRAHNGEQTLLTQLTKLTAAIEGRMSHMSKAVKGVDILAVNAKIVAAGIGDAGADFVSFANDIRRTLKLAETSLAHFSHELAGMAAQLAAATAAQLAFDERQGETVRRIPARLAASIDAIAAHRARAAAAAAIVSERSQDVGRRVGSAVIALQIGDVTRQRTEHVDAALGLLAEIVASAGSARDRDGDWSALSPGQRESLLALGCRLQSAQLADTVQELDRELHQILSVLKGLAGDAREIRRLSNDAYGAADDRRGGFLGALEEEVRQTHELLEDFGNARIEADRVGVSVGDAAANLASHIATVRSLEADIRIMGLNTTLKSARLANQGLPLRIIAQELRNYANQIAVEAGAIMTDVETIVATARPLSGGAQDGDAGAVAEIMTDAVARLGIAGASLSDALATLEHDSDVVAGLLDETVAFIAADQEIGTAMRQAASDLTGITPTVPSDADDAGPRARMLALIERSYTMARERDIHARIADGATATQPPAIAPAHAMPAANEAALEDILF